MSFKDQLRKKVTARCSGIEFSIRRVALAEYMSELGVLPIELLPNVEEYTKAMQDQVREKANDPVFANKATKFLLSHGVAEPKIFFGDAKDCPDDEVPFEDLEADAAQLIAEVAAYSSDMAGVRKVQEFFRNGVQPGDAGHDSPEVRTTTINAPTDGDNS